MSQSFEHRLDLALDMREQRSQQKKVEYAATEAAIQHDHERFERMQARFCSEVRSTMQRVVARANRHLAKRAEECRLCEVSGYFTGPLNAGGSVCNPIAFELRVNGVELGEALIVELAHDCMVEAFLGPHCPDEPEADTIRLSLAWRPIPLDRFDADIASELLVRYVAAATAQCPAAMGQAVAQAHH